MVRCIYDGQVIAAWLLSYMGRVLILIFSCYKWLKIVFILMFGRWLLEHSYVLFALEPLLAWDIESG